VSPYAFNYHRNKSDRAFHGLAFANFNASHEAQAAVDLLNNYELDGRRLRVELKKRLPAEEEQRQRLARQSRRVTQQPVPQSNVASLGDTGGPSFTDTGGSAFGQAGQQAVVQPPAESIPLESDDILEPQLRPRIVFEPTTPTPETGGMFLQKLMLI
jgi:RNA recognition motif-containing protein